MYQPLESEYLGSTSQRAFLQECRLSGGRAEGVRAVIAHGGNGLEYMVLPDRAMDIPYIFYKGQALHYSSPTGIVHPAYYDGRGTNWLKGFFAGALTSCGISFSGQPETDGAEELGLHGGLSYTPAEQVRCYEKLNDSHIYLRVEGKIKEVSAFGVNVELHRTVETDTKSPCITIIDNIRNCGYSDVPLMMLYHFNFGYPLLNEHARVYGDFASTAGGNKISSHEEELRNHKNCIPPADSYSERVFLHSWAEEKGSKKVGILQYPKKDSGVLGLVLSYEGAQLPKLVQWKVMQKGAYVMGLEPCTVFPTGRADNREAGTLPVLAPGESRLIAIKYQVTENRKDFESLMS